MRLPLNLAGKKRMEMYRIPLKNVSRALWMAASLAMAMPASSANTQDDQGTLRVQSSLKTHHYSAEAEHNNNQDLINLEWTFSQALSDRVTGGMHSNGRLRWIGGVAHFRNSFSQKSQYIYAGGRWHYPVGSDLDLYVKMTAGAIHGYRGEYQNKIPFNHLGFAPAILPGLGIEYRRLHVELVPFGVAGMMLATGIRF